MQEIKDEVERNPIVQVNKKPSSDTLRYPISAPSNSYQSDLMFFPAYKRQNHEYPIILNIIEVTSWYLCSYSVKSKSDAHQAFKDLIKIKV